MRARAGDRSRSASRRRPEPGWRRSIGAVGRPRGGQGAAATSSSRARPACAARRRARDGFRPAARSPAPPRADAAVADVTNSGELDIVTPRRALDRARARATGGRPSPPGERVLPFDFDADGDLDLYVVPAEAGDRLLRNNLDGTWTDVTARPACRRASPRALAVAADFDRDGDIDLLLASCGGGLGAARQPAGRPAGRCATAGLPHSGASRGRGRGRPRRRRAPRPRLGRRTSGAFVALNRGDGTFGAGEALGPGDAPLLFDFDNDGVLDLLLRRARGLDALPQRRAAAVSPRAGRSASRRDARPRPWTPTATAISTWCSSRRGGAAVLYENDGGNANGWIDVALEGLPTGSAKVNRFGYGSEVEARAGDALRLSARPSRPVTHLGLGARRRADVLRIVWTNGIPQNALDPPVRTLLREVQQLKGSCPFLYAFDGERWHFVTDVLGRAPAGLLYDGVHQAAADTREWLVVPGRWLAPADGRAPARLHRGALGDGLLRPGRAARRGPPGRESRSSRTRRWCRRRSRRRSSSPSRARRRRARRTSAGRDRTAEIAREDGVYLGGFAPTRYQGIVEPHELVLELPRGARRAPRHALPDGLDLLRRHVDQRLPLAARAT